MTIRSDVRFAVDDGIELGAWLYSSKSAMDNVALPSRWPTVTPA